MAECPLPRLGLTSVPKSSTVPPLLLLLLLFVPVLLNDVALINSSSVSNCGVLRDESIDDTQVVSPGVPVGVRFKGNVTLLRFEADLPNRSLESHSWRESKANSRLKIYIKRDQCLIPIGCAFIKKIIPSPAVIDQNNKYYKSV